MNIKEEIFCRLCFRVRETDYEVIDSTTRTMLDTVLLKRINWNISEKLFICQECLKIMTKCYYFKTTCIDKVKWTTLGLKDKQEDREGTEAFIPQGFTTCPFCMNNIKVDNCISVDTLLKESSFLHILPVITPNMNVDAVKDCITCVSCGDNFQSYLKFIIKCFDIEDQISRYVEDQRLQNNMSGIILNDIHNLLFGRVQELPSKCIGISKIKQEVDEFDVNQELVVPEFVTIGTDLDIKDEVANMEENTEKVSVENKRSITKRIKQKNTIEGISTSSKNSMAKKYKCEICTYETNFKSWLKIHSLTHKDTSEVDMYKCSICTFQTKRKYYIKKHEKNHKEITSEVTMYQCDKCTYKTKQPYALKRHSIIHEDDIPMYKCTICTFKAKHPSYVQKHLKMHEDSLRPTMYKCDLCAYETKFKVYLHGHKSRIHKASSKMQIYKCESCSYECKQKNYLRIHMLSHKAIPDVVSYKCAECEFKTKWRGNFILHVKTHKDSSMLEMYKCASCDFETKWKKCIASHIHTVHKRP